MAGYDLYGTGGSKPQPMQQPGNFAELQRRGMARPARPSFSRYGGRGPIGQPIMDPARLTDRSGMAITPPQQQQPGTPTPPPAQPNPTQTMGGALYDRVLGALNTPSRYDQGVVKSTYDMLKGQLDEDYRINRERDDEEFARRGLFYSTPAQGRLGDRGVQHERAQRDLAAGLLDRQASTYQGDLLNSIQAAMGYGQQQFDNQLQTSMFNNQLDQQQLQAILAALGYTQ